jgi:hypothetical protein
METEFGATIKLESGSGMGVGVSESVLERWELKRAPQGKGKECEVEVVGLDFCL